MECAAMNETVTIDPHFFAGNMTAATRVRYHAALWVIHDDFGGEVSATQAVRPLAAALARRGYEVTGTTVGRMVGHMERKGWIARDGGGAVGVRTRRIRLAIDALPPCPWPRHEPEPEPEVAPTTKIGDG